MNQLDGIIGSIYKLLDGIAEKTSGVMSVTMIWLLVIEIALMGYMIAMGKITHGNEVLWKIITTGVVIWVAKNLNTLAAKMLSGFIILINLLVPVGGEYVSHTDENGKIVSERYDFRKPAQTAMKMLGGTIGYLSSVSDLKTGRELSGQEEIDLEKEYRKEFDDGLGATGMKTSGEYVGEKIKYEKVKALNEPLFPSFAEQIMMKVFLFVVMIFVIVVVLVSVINLVLAYIGLQIITIWGLILLPFTLLKPIEFMGGNVIKGVFSNIIKYSLIYFILLLGMRLLVNNTILESLAKNKAEFIFIVIEKCIVCWLIYWLTSKADGFANELISGSPSVQGLGLRSVAGTMAGMAGLAAIGAYTASARTLGAGAAGAGAFNAARSEGASMRTAFSSAFNVGSRSLWSAVLKDMNMLGHVVGNKIRGAAGLPQYNLSHRYDKDSPDTMASKWQNAVSSGGSAYLSDKDSVAKANNEGGKVQAARLQDEITRGVNSQIPS